MPCPPHPLELREMSLTRQSGIVWRKATAIQTTLKIFDQISPAIDLDRLKIENSKRYNLLQKRVLLQENLAKDYPVPETLNLKPAFNLEDGQETMIEADRIMDRFEEKLSEMYCKYEVDLCVFRDLLVNLSPYLTLVEPSKEIKSALKEEKKLHLQHRKEDQAAQIKQLRNQMKNMQGNNSERTINPKIEAIKDQIARIESFSNEELLSDRDLF